MRRLAICVLMMVGSAISGCQTLQDAMGVEPKGTVASDSFCAIAQPILWSTKDTDQTIEQAKELNAVGKALCHWQGHK